MVFDIPVREREHIQTHNTTKDVVLGLPAGQWVVLNDHDATPYLVLTSAHVPLCLIRINV